MLGLHVKSLETLKLSKQVLHMYSALDINEEFCESDFINTDETVIIFEGCLKISLIFDMNRGDVWNDRLNEFVTMFEKISWEINKLWEKSCRAFSGFCMRVVPKDGDLFVNSIKLCKKYSIVNIGKLSRENRIFFSSDS